MKNTSPTDIDHATADLTAIDTPSVLIDIDQVKSNIARAQAHFDAIGMALRPHIKTHKLPQIAKMQLEAGAKGITCQKISEAEIMVDAGIDDIFVTFNIVGSTKLTRLVALADRVGKLTVVADNIHVVNGLAEAFADSKSTLNVMVECETGGLRCGVQTVAEAVALAQEIEKGQGLRFAGLMTYPKPKTEAATGAFLTSCLDALQQAGIVCPDVSSGGSPGMWRAAEVPVATEYRVGTYVFGDRSMVDRGVYAWADCAMSVVVTVVSTPTPNRAVVDAGSKVFSSDLLGMDGFGHVIGHPEISFTRLTEEHGILERSDAPTGLAVGQKIRIIPNHCCVVTNLANQLVFRSENAPSELVAVAARGMVQ